MQQIPNTEMWLVEDEARRPIRLEMEGESHCFFSRFDSQGADIYFPDSLVSPAPR